MSGSERPSSPLASLDAWMAGDPWRPRLVPFFLWIVFLIPGGFAATAFPVLQPIIYSLAILAVGFVMWRYRKLTPELSLRFHWTVIPSAVLLTWAWIALGELMVASGLPKFSDTLEGTHEFQDMRAMHGEDLFWTAMSLRLIGMALMVPFLEELFIRSAMLRGLHRPRDTGTGLMQFICDLPVIGDWLVTTNAGKRAERADPMLTRQLVETPVGSVTYFAVAASTFVFMLSHAPRDWPGCIACGVVWCAMVWYTNRGQTGSEEQRDEGPDHSRLTPTTQTCIANSRPRPCGLGPVIWSHALVNAGLWVYTLHTGDWQWL